MAESEFCREINRSFGDPVECVRLKGHAGSHFGWNTKAKTERWRTWNVGGSQESSDALVYDCEICGCPSVDVKEHYRKGVFPPDILEHNWCFGCMFWTEHVQRYQELEPSRKKIVTTHWTMFAPQGTHGSVSPARFGPFQNVITGEILENQQMWCSGEIPEHFRKYFKAEWQEMNAIPSTYTGVQ